MGATVPLDESEVSTSLATSRCDKPAANALGGRGLGIVDRLALRWGVYTRQDGSETTVWAALPLSGDAERVAESVAENGPRGHNGTGPGLVIASSRDA